MQQHNAKQNPLPSGMGSIKIYRIITGLLVVTSLLLVGCVSYDSVITIPEKTKPVPSYTPTGDEPPTDRTWITPSKVNVGNYYPGGIAEYPVTIHNGKDTAASFSVTYRYPDHVGEGYDKPSLEAQDWIIIVDSTPMLMSKETKDVLVVLAMPKETKIDSKKWEFWIGVIDTTQTGTVRTELAVRWLVEMKKI